MIAEAETVSSAPPTPQVRMRRAPEIAPSSRAAAEHRQPVGLELDGPGAGSV